MGYKGIGAGFRNSNDYSRFIPNKIRWISTFEPLKNSMGFWDKILSRQQTTVPEISFGRFSDAYKSKEQYADWDASLKLFEEQNCKEAIKHLLQYLKNQSGDNLIIEQEGKFILYQGSKQINCTYDDRIFKAVCLVAHCKELNVGFLRKAVEYNYRLNYARFALDSENNLCLIFDSLLADASPYKLYYGLKELALQADKDDDILLDEFEYLEPIQNHHIKTLSPEIIAIKIQFIRAQIQKVFEPNVLGTLNPRRFQGALTYIYLAVVYDLDYLVKPEGKLMDILGSMHIRYFETAPENTELKVSILETGLKEILEMKDEDLAKELYEVIASFGITSPVKQPTIAQFIDAELQAIKWYEENKHEGICLAICNYIAGYCLYNFAMPEPVRSLFHLYFQISFDSYFKSLGFPMNYWKNERTLNFNEINDEIETILDKFQNAFSDELPKAKFKDSAPNLFLKEFLVFIKDLPLT